MASIPETIPQSWGGTVSLHAHLPGGREGAVGTVESVGLALESDASGVRPLRAPPRAAWGGPPSSNCPSRCWPFEVPFVEFWPQQRHALDGLQWRQSSGTGSNPRGDLPPLGCSYPSVSGYEQHEVGTSVDASTQSERARSATTRPNSPRPVLDLQTSDPGPSRWRRSPSGRESSGYDVSRRGHARFTQAVEHRARDQRSNRRVADERHRPVGLRCERDPAG
jgi:hypothetical protein